MLLPFADYQAMKLGKPKSEALIPNQVVNYAMDNDVSALRAWRDYLNLTQSDIAGRMGITQSAFAQLEGRKNLRKSTREKVALALGLEPEQLDF